MGQAPPCDKQKQEAPPQTPFPACLLSCLLMSVSTGRDVIGQVIQPHVTAASVQRHRGFKGGVERVNCNIFIFRKNLYLFSCWSSEGNRLSHSDIMALERISFFGVSV